MKCSPGHGKPSLTPDPMPGETCPNPARFAPYWHPCELILPSAYPALPFPSLGKPSAFLPGSFVTGWLSWHPWGDWDGRHHPELSFGAARAGQRRGLPWLTPSAASSANLTDARSKETETKPEKNEAAAGKHVGRLLLGTVGSAGAPACVGIYLYCCSEPPQAASPAEKQAVIAGDISARWEKQLK